MRSVLHSGPAKAERLVPSMSLFILLALFGGHLPAAAGQELTISPLAPEHANAFVFSPEVEVKVQFKMINAGDRPAQVRLSAKTHAGNVLAPPATAALEAGNEKVVSFRLGRLPGGLHQLELAVTQGGESGRKSRYPLAVIERQKIDYQPPLFPVGVTIKGVAHLRGRSAIYLNTYTHAMAHDLRKHHFNTVVLDELFGAEQIAIFAGYGISVVLLQPDEEGLKLKPVIGGILTENPRRAQIEDLMKKHRALKAKVEKPLMICVRGEKAGTHSSENPIRLWGDVWRNLLRDHKRLEYMLPHVRRYWSCYPIEHGFPHPLLQSHASRGSHSFIDGLCQVGKPDAGFISYMVDVEDEGDGKEGPGKGEQDAKRKEKEKEKKKKKKEQRRVWESVAQIPAWVKLQAFGGPRDRSLHKVPTPSQLKTMMLLSLAHNARGIMLDCYQTDQPALSGMVDPLSLQPTDGRLAAGAEVARLIAKHADVFRQARCGGSLFYSNPYAFTVNLTTGSREKDNLKQYVYVINLNTREATSFWLYNTPRSLRDIDTGEELKAEMYRTRERHFWGMPMTLEPGQARIMEWADLRPAMVQ